MQMNVHEIGATLRHLPRVRPGSRRPHVVMLALVLPCGMLFGAPRTVSAQCATSSSNGGIAQAGGAPCTVSTPVTVGFGTAVAASNSADVTTNAAVTAHGFGTGISANTNSI